MPHLIDTHAHLDEAIYGSDLDVVIRQAQADDIWIVTVGSDYASSQRAIAIAEQYPTGVYAAIGLHPRRVSHEELVEDKLLDLEKFGNLARHPKVIAIGETGLDYHLLNDLHHRKDRALIGRIKDNQRQVFGRFLQIASECRLPVLLHCREAHEDMLDILERWDKTGRPADVRGIVHHFSGNWKDARRYFKLDFMISATALMTYGAHQEEIFRKAPLDRIVLESDCPHMTPVPWSQRRSEPTYLTTLAVALAGLKGESVPHIAKITTDNALKVLTRLSA